MVTTSRSSSKIQNDHHLNPELENYHSNKDCKQISTHEIPANKIDTGARVDSSTNGDNSNRATPTDKDNRMSNGDSPIDKDNKTSKGGSPSDKDNRNSNRDVPPNHDDSSSHRVTATDKYSSKSKLDSPSHHDTNKDSKISKHDSPIDKDENSSNRDSPTNKSVKISDQDISTIKESTKSKHGSTGKESRTSKRDSTTNKDASISKRDSPISKDSRGLKCDSSTYKDGMKSKQKNPGNKEGTSSKRDLQEVKDSRTSKHDLPTNKDPSRSKNNKDCTIVSEDTSTNKVDTLSNGNETNISFPAKLVNKNETINKSESVGKVEFSSGKSAVKQTIGENDLNSKKFSNCEDKAVKDEKEKSMVSDIRNKDKLQNLEHKSTTVDDQTRDTDGIVTKKEKVKKIKKVKQDKVKKVISKNDAKSDVLKNENLKQESSTKEVVLIQEDVSQSPHDVSKDTIDGQIKKANEKVGRINKNNDTVEQESKDIVNSANSDILENEVNNSNIENVPSNTRLNIKIDKSLNKKQTSEKISRNSFEKKTLSKKTPSDKDKTGNIKSVHTTKNNNNYDKVDIKSKEDSQRKLKHDLENKKDIELDSNSKKNMDLLSKKKESNQSKITIKKDNLETHEIKKEVEATDVNRKDNLNGNKNHEKAERIPETSEVQLIREQTDIKSKNSKDTANKNDNDYNNDIKKIRNEVKIDSSNCIASIPVDNCIEDVNILPKTDDILVIEKSKEKESYNKNDRDLEIENDIVVDMSLNRNLVIDDNIDKTTKNTDIKSNDIQKAIVDVKPKSVLKKTSSFLIESHESSTSEKMLKNNSEITKSSIEDNQDIAHINVNSPDTIIHNDRIMSSVTDSSDESRDKMERNIDNTESSQIKICVELEEDDISEEQRIKLADIAGIYSSMERKDSIGLIKQTKKKRTDKSRAERNSKSLKKHQDSVDYSIMTDEIIGLMGDEVILNVDNMTTNEKLDNLIEQNNKIAVSSDKLSPYTVFPTEKTYISDKISNDEIDIKNCIKERIMCGKDKNRLIYENQYAQIDNKDDNLNDTEKHVSDISNQSQNSSNIVDKKESKDLPNKTIEDIPEKLFDAKDILPQTKSADQLMDDSAEVTTKSVKSSDISDEVFDSQSSSQQPGNEVGCEENGVNGVGREDVEMTEAASRRRAFQKRSCGTGEMSRSIRTTIESVIEDMTNEILNDDGDYSFDEGLVEEEQSPMLVDTKSGKDNSDHKLIGDIDEVINIKKVNSSITNCELTICNENNEEDHQDRDHIEERSESVIEEFTIESNTDKDDSVSDETQVSVACNSKERITDQDEYHNLDIETKLQRSHEDYQLQEYLNNG